MATVCIRQLFLQQTGVSSHVKLSSSSSSSSSLIGSRSQFESIIRMSCRLVGCKISREHSTMIVVPKASPANNNIIPAANEDDGVSLGTMKLPLDTDLTKFESLLFQWANSLFQGANLPLPMPLKVDKIPGGARLGFITIGDGATEVLVYIDCFVSPASDASAPIFRAIRNGPLKDKSPPGEPRIMKSLLAALQTSVELARV